MRKYGIQRQHIHGYPDINIPKCQPWWVSSHNGKSKKRERQLCKKLIAEEIADR